MNWLEIAFYAVLGASALISIVAAISIMYWRDDGPW
jgi:hypothetical protein